MTHKQNDIFREYMEEYEAIWLQKEAEMLYELDPVKAVKRAKYILAIHEGKLREEELKEEMNTHKNYAYQD